MSEIEAMQVLDSALSSLESDARQRVLIWATSKFGSFNDQIAAIPSIVSTGTESSIAPGKKKISSSKSAKKSKSVISIDKNLNLLPNGQMSANDFATKKAPTNHLEKGLVAVYYLSRILEIEAVNLSQVYTFYKHMSWQVPANLANALRKAGVEGWLDTSDQNDIKVAVGGENYVEHKMGGGS